MEAAGSAEYVFAGLVGLREVHIVLMGDGQADEVAFILEQIPSLEVVSIEKTDDEVQGYYPLPARTWLAIQRLPNLNRLLLRGLAMPSIDKCSLVMLKRLALEECDIKVPDLFRILSATSDQ
jgi:hypothetical protein